MSDGVTRGILEAHRAGAVNAASMFANTPGFAGAVTASGEAPGLELGLHFNVTIGAPVSAPSAVATLCDATGEFVSPGRLLARALAGRIEPEEVALECRAQLERLRANGIAVTHLDSHRHVHVLPGIWKGITAVGAAEGIPVRVPVEPPIGRRALAKLAIRGSWWISARRGLERGRSCRGIGLLGGRHFPEALIRTLDALPPGGTEVVVHPGYADADLATWDSYTNGRECELLALRSPQVLARLTKGDLRLVRFADL